MHFFQGKVRHLRCSGLLTSKGTLWNQSETMRTSKKLSILSKTAKNGNHLVFQGDGSLDALFSRKGETFKLLWTYHMSG